MCYLCKSPSRRRSDQPKSYPEFLQRVESQNEKNTQSPTMASVASLVCLSNLPSSSQALKRFNGIRLLPSPTSFTLKTSVSSSEALSTPLPIYPHSFITTPKPSTFTVFAAKGYKMKTHKVLVFTFLFALGAILRRTCVFFARDEI